jgi:hypothetical protein
VVWRRRRGVEEIELVAVDGVKEEEEVVVVVEEETIG